jgi:adenylate cyclase
VGIYIFDRMGRDGDRAYTPAEQHVDEASEESAARLARLRHAATNLDGQSSLVEAARQLRRRIPGDEKFGDPLSTAGRTPVEVIARGVSALRPEPESFSRELGLAALQVWQSISEATGRGRGDQEMALLFTDLVGFSSWALNAGDEEALELLRAVGSAVESAILCHDGRIVKRLGDGLMATFLKPEAAIGAALQANESLTSVEVNGYQPRMRAGIHWGRPRKIGGDYLGVDVNIAARVAAAAKAEQVLVSETICMQLQQDEFSFGRAKRLKADGAPRRLEVVPVTRK